MDFKMSRYYNILHFNNLFFLLSMYILDSQIITVFLFLCFYT